MNTDTTYLKFFADFVASKLGIVYNDMNYYQLEARLLEVAKIMNLPDIRALYEKAQSGMRGDFENLVINYAVNNETFFFRDKDLFTAIEQHIIQPYGTGSQVNKRPFRVWSAACSFGQEVYSLAILLERCAAKYASFRYEIVATDVSERALDYAKAGQYNQLQIERGLDPDDIKRYFESPTGEGLAKSWKVRADLRRNASFKRLNLLDSFDGLGLFDLVLCRNVLIYQPLDNRIKVVKRIHERLHQDGYLVMGSAESLVGISEDFDIAAGFGVTVFRKKTFPMQKVG